jgi:ribosomal protein S12 methylthiotransferase
MMGHLLKAGFQMSDSEFSDVILVNTCAFIEPAREEAVSEILRACEMKEEGYCKAVVVSGCLAQRYREELCAAFPLVDAFIGIDSLDKIVSLVEKIEKNAARKTARKQDVLIPPGQPKMIFDPPIAALRFTGPAFAYLKIAEGCAHRCAYCAIPGIRGNCRSRSVKSIVKEARELIKTGVKELNIVAQDPLLYGIDFKDGTNIVTLLKALDRIKGDFWIRVLYAYPNEISDEFIRWMNTSPHAVKYIDVPLQHTRPEVLKAMNRGAAAKASLEASEKLRREIPGVTLRTTIMTGFPGETPTRYKLMLEDIKRMKFDHLGAFAFSPEEGTLAAEMDNQVDPEIAERRVELVVDLQSRIMDEFNESRLGGVEEVLCEGFDSAEGCYVGRTYADSVEIDGRVLFTAAGLIPAGTFVNVRITGVTDGDLTGEIEE